MKASKTCKQRGPTCVQQAPGLSPYLHEGVAVHGESSTGHLLEAFTDVRQGACSQNLRLMVKDESQSDSEQNFGSLVEKTIPDPQNRLGVRRKQTVPVRTFEDAVAAV